VITKTGPETTAIELDLYTYDSAIVTSMHLSGTLGSGDTLVVDCDAMTITKNGVNALALLTSGDFMKLDPALGNFALSHWPQIAMTGTAGTVAYRKAWR